MLGGRVLEGGGHLLSKGLEAQRGDKIVSLSWALGFIILGASLSSCWPGMSLISLCESQVLTYENSTTMLT